jgi:hypothetical protein
LDISICRSRINPTSMGEVQPIPWQIPDFIEPSTA